jgi:hypothetical protein
MEKITILLEVKYFPTDKKASASNRFPGTFCVGLESVGTFI